MGAHPRRSQHGHAQRPRRRPVGHDAVAAVAALRHSLAAAARLGEAAAVVLRSAPPTEGGTAAVAAARAPAAPRPRVGRFTLEDVGLFCNGEAIETPSGTIGAAQANISGAHGTYGQFSKLTAKLLALPATGFALPASHRRHDALLDAPRLG